MQLSNGLLYIVVLHLDVNCVGLDLNSAISNRATVLLVCTLM